MSDIKSNIKNLREDFNSHKIDFKDLPKHPISLFHHWIEKELQEHKKAISFVLSTISKDTTPSSRVVLLRDFDEDGFTFFTNYKSAKSIDIEKNNKVALNFYWPDSQRQVRIVGNAEKISAKESEQYFSSRPRESQLGAWISEQSKIIDLSFKLTIKMEKLKNTFKGKIVEKPKYWGGYKVKPISLEFWQGRPFRLHQRIRYTVSKNEWKTERLAP